MATYELSYWYKRGGNTNWQRHSELIEADTDDEAKKKAKYPLDCYLPTICYQAQLQKVEQPKKKKNTLAWKPISYSR